jgi:hypothetical protein
MGVLTSRVPEASVKKLQKRVTTIPSALAQGSANRRFSVRTAIECDPKWLSEGS